MNPESSVSLAPRFAWSVCLLLLCLLMASGQALAQRADRLAPMNIEADKLQYDDANQVSIFTGHVVVTKGSLILRGQRLEVRQDAQGNARGVIQGGANSRAFFRQKRDGLDEFVEGEAQRIEYDSLSETVIFTGQAVLRRYRGTTLSDETQGSRIVYNGARETFTVEGGTDGRTTENPTGRVRALLTPSGTNESTPPATDSAPALTPSPRLELRP